MGLIHNEQTKLTATFANGMAVAILAVGGLAHFWTRAAIKSFTTTDSGNLGNYIGISSLKPFINSDLILGETEPAEP